jgi:hypothetical protein
MLLFYIFLKDGGYFNKKQKSNEFKYTGKTQNPWW